MGEAKRRQVLGIPPRKITLNNKKSDKFSSWLPITKSRLKKYPYMGVVTMAFNSHISKPIWNNFFFNMIIIQC